MTSLFSNITSEGVVNTLVHASELRTQFDLEQWINSRFKTVFQALNLLNFP